MKLKKKILIIMLMLIEFSTFCFASSKEYFVDTLNKQIEDFDEIEDVAKIEEEREKIYSESAILIEQQTGKVLYEVVGSGESVTLIPYNINENLPLNINKNEMRKLTKASATQMVRASNVTVERAYVK